MPPADLNAIFKQLRPLLSAYQPPFEPKRDEPGYYDLWAFKDVVIDGRKRKEVYFAGLVTQKYHVGFYFMPIYVETSLATVFEPELLALLKGKSCFHVKKLDEQIIMQIRSALVIGFDLYQERGWV
jgi:hypothetical protein